ncbi:MAG: macro domain-containing protein [Chloroflexota bacterium]
MQFYLPPLFNPVQWIYSFSLSAAVKQFLTSLGFLWLLTEVANFFFPHRTEVLVSDRPFVFLGLAILHAFWSIRPKTIYRHTLRDRDVDIEIRVVDIFQIRGDLIVPINDLFQADIGGRMVNAKSVQGSLLRRYYDSVPDRLQADIYAWLEKFPYEYSTPENVMLDGMEFKKYPIGSVVPVNANNRKVYLLANTSINGKGTATSCSEDELLQALRSLWVYVSTKGSHGHLVIPLIGTQHGRLPLKRQRVVQHILRTFVESCADSSYCKTLTVVIYPPDVKRHRINLNEINDILQFEATHAYFTKA